MRPASLHAKAGRPDVRPKVDVPSLKTQRQLLQDELNATAGFSIIVANCQCDVRFTSHSPLARGFHLPSFVADSGLAPLRVPVHRWSPSLNRFGKRLRELDYIEAHTFS